MMQAIKSNSSERARNGFGEKMTQASELDSLKNWFDY